MATGNLDRYALLMRLPLFQGICGTELLHWEEALRLDIDELPATRLPLLRQGDNCSLLLYLVEGELLREHHSPDGIYATRSSLKAPAVIEVDRLYGLTPTYQHTYFAKTDVGMLSIRKSLAQSLLMKSEVFRINLLNTLSAICQKRTAALLPHTMDTAEERLRHFLATIFPDAEGEVEVFIKMKDLARYIGERRITVSQILNRWKEEGNIRLGREHFTIFDIAWIHAPRANFFSPTV